MTEASNGHGWTHYVTGDLIAEGKLSIGDGYRAKNSELADAGLPFARAGNINDGFQFEDADHFPEADLAKVGEKISQPGDVVFTSKGTVGRLAYVRASTPRFVYAPQLCYWRTLDPNLIDDRWLYYWMCGREFRQQMAGVKGQTDMADYVSLSDQRRMEILLPPIDWQRAIAGVLSSMDDKIEQNRRTSRALEKLARAIFEAWFVDFEPVKAKAAGAQNFPGMPAAFGALPTRLVESEFGPVPEGWPVRSVAEAFEVNPPRRLAKGQVAPYLDMKNMPMQGHAPEVWEQRRCGSGMRFINGDTLVARITPCLENGKTAFVDFLTDGEVAWGSTEYIVLRPKPPLPELFAYCLARTTTFRDFAIRNMTGTSGRQRVAASALEHYRIAVPDARVAIAFAEIVAPLFQRIRAAMNESRKLSELRDYLLPRLLSGEVRVGVGTTKSSVIAPVGQEATAKPARKATDEFKEAILIAALVRAVATPLYPLGRKRYNKIAYFVHRKAEHDVRQQYLKKAAGPYSPWAKYQGPEKIALANGYVQPCQSGKLSGLIAGDKIGAIDQYLSRYGFQGAIDWAVAQFRFKKNDDLELLATVDFAALDLMDRVQSVNTQALRDLIANEPEWAPKLDRAIFSDQNIAKALAELERLLPDRKESP